MALDRRTMGVQARPSPPRRRASSPRSVI